MRFTIYFGPTPSMVLILLTLLINLRIAQGTVGCRSCRPIALQEGLGIGFSLSFGYGAAVVRFANGTALKVASVNGSQEYVKAMKSWPDSGTPWIPLPEPTLFQRVLVYFGLRKLESHRLQTPPSLMPLVDMVQALWQATSESVHIEHYAVYVSVPEFVFDSPNSWDILKAILLSAAVENSHGTSLVASSLSGQYLCQGELLGNATLATCDIDNATNILFVHLDKVSLILRSISLDEGLIEPGLVSTRLIWREADTNLEDEIDQFVIEKFDRVVLAGVEATELHDIIKRVFDKKDTPMPETYACSTEEHTFTAPEGAA